MSEREQFEKWWREWTHVHMTDKSLAWSAWEASRAALSRESLEPRMTKPAAPAPYEPKVGDRVRRVASPNWNSIDREGVTPPTKPIGSEFIVGRVEVATERDQMPTGEKWAVIPEPRDGWRYFQSQVEFVSKPAAPEACPTCGSERRDVPCCVNVEKPKDHDHVPYGRDCRACRDPFHAPPSPRGESDLERAARVCDERAERHRMKPTDDLGESYELGYRNNEAKDCAAAIRALGPSKPAAMVELSLRDLQAQLPWTIKYHHDFRASPVAHKDFQHALIHVFKAAGKLAAMVNDAEHAGFDWAQDLSPDPYIADLVICALRMANTVPSRKCDLQHAVEDRIESKNGVTLNRALLKSSGGGAKGGGSDGE